MGKEPLVEKPHWDDHAVPGFPGYRTREGMSGLNPVDTYRESAYQEGKFYRNLFALRLRTRYWLHLVLMAVFGGSFLLITSIFLAGTILEWNSEVSQLSYLRLAATLPVFILSAFLVANLVINLAVMMNIDDRLRSRRKHQG